MASPAKVVGVIPFQATSCVSAPEKLTGSSWTRLPAESSTFTFACPARREVTRSVGLTRPWTK